MIGAVGTENDAFGQTINLFSLAGLAIAIGEMADATIVIVENCTAQLAARRNLGAAEKVRTIIRATATMTSTFST